MSSDGKRPATAAEAAQALQAGGMADPETRAVITSYLSAGPEPRYHTAAARDEAEAGQ